MFQSLSGLTLCLNSFKKVFPWVNFRVSIPFRADTVFEQSRMSALAMTMKFQSLSGLTLCLNQNILENVVGSVWGFNPFQG